MKLSRTAATEGLTTMVNIFARTHGMASGEVCLAMLTSMTARIAADLDVDKATNNPEVMAVFDAAVADFRRTVFNAE